MRPDVIGMDEKPIDSLRKKPRSSIGVLAKLAKTGPGRRGDLGGQHRGVRGGVPDADAHPAGREPARASRWCFPSPSGPVTICDVGANIACKPINLYQYGLMASIYSKNFLGIQNPRIGLMSIGEEEAKGNEIVKKAAGSAARRSRG